MDDPVVYRVPLAPRPPKGQPPKRTWFAKVVDWVKKATVIPWAVDLAGRYLEAKVNEKEADARAKRAGAAVVEEEAITKRIANVESAMRIYSDRQARAQDPGQPQPIIDPEEAAARVARAAERIRLAGGSTAVEQDESATPPDAVFFGVTGTGKTPTGQGFGFVQMGNPDPQDPPATEKTESGG